MCSKGVVYKLRQPTEKPVLVSTRPQKTLLGFLITTVPTQYNAGISQKNQKITLEKKLLVYICYIQWLFFLTQEFFHMMRQLFSEIEGSGNLEKSELRGERGCQDVQRTPCILSQLLSA